MDGQSGSDERRHDGGNGVLGRDLDDPVTARQHTRLVVSQLNSFLNLDT